MCTGFDHEPVIVSKETIPPRFKAAKIADNVPKGGAPSPAAATTVNGKPSGAAAAVSEQLVNSPTVPADGRPAPRHSFSAPFSSRLVPHWELGAGATAETEFIRLTPARQSRTGYAWNSVEVEMSDWEVLIEFSVKGKPNLGGDGFAFWFVERPEILGSVYGSSDFCQCAEQDGRMGAGDSRCAAALSSLFQRVILTLLSMLFLCV